MAQTTNLRLRFIPSKAKLVALNLKADNMEFNRVIAPESLRTLKDARYPIGQTVGFDTFVRCRLILDAEAHIVYLDMTWADYNALPVWEGDKP